MLYKNFVFIVLITTATNVAYVMNGHIDNNSRYFIITLGLVFCHLLSMIISFNVKFITFEFLDLLTFMSSTSLLSVGLHMHNTRKSFDLIFIIEVIVSVVIWALLVEFIGRKFGKK